MPGAPAAPGFLEKSATQASQARGQGLLERPSGPASCWADHVQAPLRHAYRTGKSQEPWSAGGIPDVCREGSRMFSAVLYFPLSHILTEPCLIKSRKGQHPCVLGGMKDG